MLSAGEATVSWDKMNLQGKSVSPGVYFVKVEMRRYGKTHRVVIIDWTAAKSKSPALDATRVPKQDSNLGAPVAGVAGIRGLRL